MIHAPSLLPDEDVRAYWGRVLRINGIPDCASDDASFAKHARDEFGVKKGALNDLCPVVGAVAGIPLAALVRAHTVVPYSGAVGGTVGADWCDDSYSSWELRRHETKSHVERRAFCPMCAHEDLRFWGFSYWRRSQQIVGTVWCQKHGCALFYENRPNTWRTMPHEASQKARPESDAVVAHAVENPVLRRHAEVCAELLHRPRPLAGFQVLRSLVQRAYADGLVTDQRETGRRLSDMGMERISGPWQQRFWNQLSEKVPGAYAPSLDDTLTRLRGFSWQHGYALAFALLYDSVEDAFNDLERKLPTFKSLLPLLDMNIEHVAHRALWHVKGSAKNRPERLRAVIKQVLSGCPLDSAAREGGWAGDSVGRMLIRCLAPRPPSHPEGSGATARISALASA